MAALNHKVYAQLAALIEENGISAILGGISSIISEHPGTFAETGKPAKTGKKVSLTQSKEVQKHGKKWENDILKTYGVSDETLDKIPYTNPHDLPSEYNKLNGKNVSIKTTGSNNICCGDAERFYDSTNEHNMEMVIVKYTEKIW